MPDDDEPTEEQEQAEPNFRRVLEKKAEKAEARSTELETENDGLRRELAFHKAGLSNLTAMQTKALLGAHDGDLTPDSLKATAAELWPDAPAPKTQEKDQERQQEAATLDRFEDAATGSNPAELDLAARLDGAQTEAELDQILRDAGFKVQSG